MTEHGDSSHQEPDQISVDRFKQLARNHLPVVTVTLVAGILTGVCASNACEGNGSVNFDLAPIQRDLDLLSDQQTENNQSLDQGLDNIIQNIDNLRLDLNQPAPLSNPNQLSEPSGLSQP